MMPAKKETELNMQKIMDKVATGEELTPEEQAMADQVLMAAKAMQDAADKPNPNSDAQMDAEVKRWGQQLAKYPKKHVRIPRLPNGPEGDCVPVGINGYVFKIKRGEDVEVPEPVYNILNDSGYLG